MASPPHEDPYCWVILTSSTAGLDQAGRGGVRGLDADADGLAREGADVARVAVAHAAASLSAAPTSWNTCVVVLPTTKTRRKSALLELLRCAM